MNAPGIIDQAIREIGRLIKTINSNQSLQIRSRDEQELIKANVSSWFYGHRNNLYSTSNNETLNLVDENFRQLLEFSDKHTSRSRYKSILKSTKMELIKLRSEAIKYSNLGMRDGPTPALFPDFSSIVRDKKMQQILENRCNEIVECLEHRAPLAATIMMGGLLEALFLAHVIKMVDKEPIFKAKAAPKDKKTGKTLPLNNWTLNAFIDVGAELGWITKPAKDVVVVLRDYRNFVHPERELSTGITLAPDDAKMFWSVCTQLAQQIINKAN